MGTYASNFTAAIRPVVHSLCACFGTRITPEFMNIEAGVRLGPYEIDSLIGRGAMFEVGKALDTKLDKELIPCRDPP